MKHNTIRRIERFTDDSPMIFSKGCEPFESIERGTDFQLFDVMSSPKKDISNNWENHPSKITKDYNTRMAINVPEDESVTMVNMWDCKIIDGTTKDHLLTYGLGPCVGVAIVIKSNNWKITRLLAHIDMGECLGISIESLSWYIKKMKNNVSGGISSVEVSLTSTQSYLDLKNLNENEKELINVISTEFK